MTKIKPAIRGPKNYVDYTNLDHGDVFVYQNQLWIVSNDFDCADRCTDQAAVNLSTGEHKYKLCGQDVLPVDVVITWTKQKE